MKLITGGAGYLGSCLARELLRRGEKVRILDLQRTKYVPEGAEFVAGDIRDWSIVRRVVRDCDVVFHLAFIQSLSKLPERTRWDVNIRGTENLFLASEQAKVRRFVHTSTIEIYGAHPPFPCTEEAPTTNPVGWYGRHKLLTEKILWRRYRHHGLQATALRMPTICGPGYYNHRPILGLLDRIIANKLLAVVGEGDLLGDFVYYKDVIQGYLLAAEKPEAIGQAFNLSAKASSTHLEILEAMKRAANSHSKIIKVPMWLARTSLFTFALLRITDLPLCQFDYVLWPSVYSIDKAKRLLGYNPEKTSAEAAVELIKHYLEDREYVKKRSWNY